MSTIWALNYIVIKHALYLGKDCMKEFCGSSGQYAKNIIDFEKKKKLPLRKEELKSHQDLKVYYICGNRILKGFSKSINYWKVRYHCHYTGKYGDAAHSICDSKLNAYNEIPVVFHNVSNYYYHFIIKELPNEFEGQLKCLMENTKKFQTFSNPIEVKEVEKLIKMEMKVL